MFAFQRFVKLFEAAEKASELCERPLLPLALPLLAFNVAVSSLLSLIMACSSGMAAVAGAGGCFASQRSAPRRRLDLHGGS